MCLGKRQMPLLHQGPAGEKFYENVRFSHRRIVFAGLNIPGGNNKVMDDKDCTKKAHVPLRSAKPATPNTWNVMPPTCSGCSRLFRLPKPGKYLHWCW